MKAKAISLSYTEDNLPQITLTLDMPRRDAQTAYAKAKEVLARGKVLEVDIKQHRRRRSLDANSMLWKILGEMAAILKTTKDELYLLMLERYGVFTHIVVKPEVVERVKQEWRTVRELGEVTVNGKTGTQLQCFFGSSTYNSKEFSVLLDGVISEAKELGIEVVSEAEKSLLIEEWGQAGKEDKPDAIPRLSTKRRMESTKSQSIPEGKRQV